MRLTRHHGSEQTGLHARECVPFVHHGPQDALLQRVLERAAPGAKQKAVLTGMMRALVAGSPVLQGVLRGVVGGGDGERPAAAAADLAQRNAEVLWWCALIKCPSSNAPHQMPLIITGPP